MSGCWSAGCWLPVCHLFNLRGPQGGYSKLLGVTCGTVFAHVFRHFFQSPFWEPNSPICVKMVPKSDQKVVQNLAFYRHGKPHSDMVFTDREPHWPIQGRVQKTQKKSVLQKTASTLTKCRKMCQKVPPGGTPGVTNEATFFVNFCLEAPGSHFGARVAAQIAKMSQNGAKMQPKSSKNNRFCFSCGLLL